MPSAATTSAGPISDLSRWPRWSTKWAIRLPCIAVSGTSSGARVSVTARITTPPAAPSSPEVAFSSTGNPITRTALAPAAAIEWAAPRRNVAVPPGVRTRAATRADGDTANSSSHPTAPATVAHRKPTRPQPSRNVATATTTRITASVTISPPYWPQLPRPASRPSRVACTQKPARPALSRVTDSGLDSLKTCGAHSGALAAMTTAAITPRPVPTRIGWVRGPSTICT